ncbi:MAG: PASTA domain-containing protein [Nitrospirae bacterium]|nr:PASTA domain-containing protein [Nitrospirota bacterium]
MKYTVFVLVFAGIGAGAAYLYFKARDTGNAGETLSLVGEGVKEMPSAVPAEELPGITMPSFEDQLLEDVKLTLANLDIRLGKVTWSHSDTVEKGKIIAQRPLPGSVHGKEINFLVSLGAYDVMYRCPSFVNMAIEEARALSEKLGIMLNEQGEGTRVASQSPEEGEIIRKGDAVEVTLGSVRTWF